MSPVDTAPRVSVIIPTYNYASHLGQAIQSALDQTYQDLEVVVVDDGSTDNTAAVVGEYYQRDPRVRYIHQENGGLPSARNTGIRAARGELFALLDADDRIHPEKIQAQVAFLDESPQIGLAYNARLLVDAEEKPLFFQRPPLRVGLKDIVSGYPFTPSDVMVRRTWAERINLYDESFILNSEDLNFNIRLALAGCQFGGVDRAYTYRKVHTGRIFRNLAGKMETYLRALDTAFDDPNCPQDVVVLRNQAYGSHYRTWGYQALAQGEFDLGQEFFRKALELVPELFEDDQNLLGFLVWSSIRDGDEHEERLRMVIDSLPEPFSHLQHEKDQAVGRGYLERAIRAALWNRMETAQKHFVQALRFGARMDEAMNRTLADQISAYEQEYGSLLAQEAVERLRAFLEKSGGKFFVRRLVGSQNIRRAYRDFQQGHYRSVPGNVLRAIYSYPALLVDRGVLSIFARSLIASVSKS